MSATDDDHATSTAPRESRESTLSSTSYHSTIEESSDLDLIDALLSLKLVSPPTTSEDVVVEVKREETVAVMESKAEIEISKQHLPLSASLPPPLPVPGSIAPDHLASDASSSAPGPSTRSKTAVIFQEACNRHVYSRNADIGSIVERPERIRAVKKGVAVALARLEAERRRSIASSSTVPLLVREEREREIEVLGGSMRSLAIDLHTEVSETSKGKAKGVEGGREFIAPLSPFDILQSHHVLPVNDPALLFIHGLPHEASNYTSPPAISPSKSPVVPILYPTQLQSWIRSSTGKIANGESEVPSHLNQGDLYLCEGSEEAIFGALGAVVEAVDLVASSSAKRTKLEGDTVEPKERGYERVFVGIRPPGHHCSESDPSGFCWFNNVAVGAAHAYLRYDINRIVILDIDLHHGNGTQEIAWRINSIANKAKNAILNSPRKGSPRKSMGVKKKRELQICYTSLHDIHSYPCEDGDPTLVQAASINLSGGHSQYISNVHLEPFSTEADFYETLYPRYRSGLLDAARSFCAKTSEGETDESDRTLIFISAGFDASEHESSGMSRHRTSVPTSFYHRFTLDAVEFANEFAEGKIVAVLEGGYSDRALSSGTLAMMTGLSDRPIVKRENAAEWWTVDALSQVERIGEKEPVPRKGKTFSAGQFANSNATMMGKGQQLHQEEEWARRTKEVFIRLEGGSDASLSGIISTTKVKEKRVIGSAISDSSRTMKLRERRLRGNDEVTPTASPVVSKTKLKAKVSSPVPAVAVVVKVEEVIEAVQPQPARVKFIWREGGM